MRCNRRAVCEPLDARLFLTTVTFQEGVNGYAATLDTHIRFDATANSFGSAAKVDVDGDDNGASGAQPVQGLLRFDSIFGALAGQIPSGSTITSATLTLRTGSTSGDSSSNAMALHRMLVDWNEASTWNSLAGGINLGTDAASTATASVTPSTLGAAVAFNVTSILEAWLANPATNFGFALIPSGTNGWAFESSEAANTALRPVLSVTFTPPGGSANQAPSVNAGPDQTVTVGSAATLDGTVLDDDLPNPPAAVTTAWSRVSGPGTVSFGNAASIDTTATFSATGTYVLRLTANDGEFVTSDDLTLTVQQAPTGPVFPNPVQLSTDTQHKPQSKVWEHNNTWFSVLPKSDGTWVWRLDGTAWNPILRLSSATNSRADTLTVGSVTHVLLQTGGGANLASIEYVNGTYQMWSQRPSVVSVPLGSGMETVTMARDGSGRLWVAYDTGTTVQVRYSDGPYSTWSSGITIATGVSTDDICAITTLSNGSVAVMWSNQSTDRFGFRTHAAGANPNTWTADENPGGAGAVNVGHGFADDHINLAPGSNGILYVAIKTGYDADSGSTSGGRPLVGLLVRRANGTWDPVYNVDTTGTRPIVVVNESANQMIVAYRLSGTGIVYRESSLTSIAFGSRKTLISGDLNNVSSTRSLVSDDVVFISTTSGNQMRSVRLFFPSQVNSAIASSNFRTAGTPITSPDDDERILISSL